MQEIKIKKATEKDLDIIVDLVAKLLLDFNDRSGSKFIVNRDKLKGVTKKLITRTNFGAFIAYDSKNIPIGLITLTEAFAIYNGGDFGVITELYVDGNSRSKGIGKLLLKSAFKFAEEMNWTKIEVGAPNSDDWPRTLEFYLRNGFKPKGPKLRVELKS